MEAPPPIVSNSYNSKKKSIKSNHSADSSKSPKQTLYIPIAHKPPASVREVPIESPDTVENGLDDQLQILSNDLASNQLQFDDGFVAESIDDLGGFAPNGEIQSPITNGNFSVGTDNDLNHQYHQNGTDAGHQIHLTGNGFHNDPEAEGEYKYSGNNNMNTSQFYNPEDTTLAYSEQHQSYIPQQQQQLSYNTASLTEIPTATQIQVSYTWKLSKIELLSSEKLVSVPFGPDEWSWQLVYDTDSILAEIG